MNDSVLPKPLCGIIPPMITPLLGQDTLDTAGLERLIEHILAGGVHGLFILGTTGEASSLSYRLRGELIERTCRQVAGRVPVLVGITDTSIVESLNLAQHAAEAGAQAVVLSAPYYFPISQPELLEYIQHIMPQLRLPVFLYNTPFSAEVIFELETLRRLMEIPNIIGLKDSSANMSYLRSVKNILHHRPDWSLLIGPEEFLGEAVLLGVHGGVCGGANLLPRLYVDLYNAAVAANLERVARLHAKVMQLMETIYAVGRHHSAFIKSLKCALACLGICDDFMAEPFHRFRRTERDIIRRYVQELGITREK